MAYISEKWKFRPGMKRRMRCAKKKEVHLTVLVESSPDDFQKVIKKIQTEVRKHNHCPENKAKASFDIIYVEGSRNHVS